MKLSRVHIILLLMLLVSCGQQYKAKQKVKDFVKEHATEEIDIASFSNLDSTRVISGQVLKAMRERAQNDTLFKNVRLGDIPASSTLLYIRMRYGEDSLNMSRTFYFDRELNEIIAFK